MDHNKTEGLVKLSNKKRKEIKKEIERIYFRKILKELVAQWLKISAKFKYN